MSWFVPEWSVVVLPLLFSMHRGPSHGVAPIVRDMSVVTIEIYITGIRQTGFLSYSISRTSLHTCFIQCISVFSRPQTLGELRLLGIGGGGCGTRSMGSRPSIEDLPPQPTRGSGEHRELPQRGPAPAANEFGAL